MNWRWPENDGEAARALARAADLSPLTAAILLRRGIGEARAAREFLQPSLNQLLDPAQLRGIDAAAKRLARAIREREPIAVYGDYDVDGISATALLLNFLRLAGAEPSSFSYYLPHRLEEGYGLNAEAVRQLAGRAKLLVTVDCGISAVAEAALARELGLDLVVTDHHEPGETLPEALAVVNPKQPGCAYPFKELSGVGVAFKLAWETCRVLTGRTRVSAEFSAFLQDAVALVALGTVADVVPLLGENRVIVRFGLAALAQAKSPGLNALAQAARLQPNKPLKAYDIAFRLAPRLNAAGRMGDAQAGVELLTTADRERAAALAGQLEAANRQRQQTEAAITESIMARAEALDRERERAIVLWSDDWHPGVIGIVASRVARRFHRPTILICLDGESGKGSGRSIPGFNLYRALAACDRWLEQFGGHAMAAGVQVAADRLEDFRRAFLERAAADLGPEDLEPALDIDAGADLEQLTLGVVGELEQLGPHGERNPRPVLASRGLQVVSPPQRLGQNGQHLALMLNQGQATRRGIWFGAGPRQDDFVLNQAVDAAYTPKIDRWGRGEKVELEIKDLKAAEE